MLRGNVNGWVGIPTCMHRSEAIQTSWSPVSTLTGSRPSRPGSSYVSKQLITDPQIHLKSANCHLNPRFHGGRSYSRSPSPSPGLRVNQSISFLLRCANLTIAFKVLTCRCFASYTTSWPNMDLIRACRLAGPLIQRQWPFNEEPWCRGRPRACRNSSFFVAVDCCTQDP